MAAQLFVDKWYGETGPNSGHAQCRATTCRMDMTRFPRTRRALAAVVEGSGHHHTALQIC
eukprot:67998-Chlamydomonas_euryale.AAC.1